MQRVVLLLIFTPTILAAAMCSGCYEGSRCTFNTTHCACASGLFAYYNLRNGSLGDALAPSSRSFDLMQMGNIFYDPVNQGYTILSGGSGHLQLKRNVYGDLSGSQMIVRVGYRPANLNNDMSLVFSGGGACGDSEVGRQRNFLIEMRNQRVRGAVYTRAGVPSEFEDEVPGIPMAQPVTLTWAVSENERLLYVDGVLFRRYSGLRDFLRAPDVQFDEFPLSFGALVNNSMTANASRHWRGNIMHVAIYSQAILDEPTIIRYQAEAERGIFANCSGCSYCYSSGACLDVRPSLGSMYTFSGANPVMDLGPWNATLSLHGNASASGGALTLKGGHALTNMTNNMLSAINQSRGFTLEIIYKPATPMQSGPARIVSLARRGGSLVQDSLITVAQKNDLLTMRTRPSAGGFHTTPHCFLSPVGTGIPLPAPMQVYDSLLFVDATLTPIQYGMRSHGFDSSSQISQGFYNASVWKETPYPLYLGARPTAAGAVNQFFGTLNYFALYSDASNRSEPLLENLGVVVGGQCVVPISSAPTSVPTPAPTVLMSTVSVTVVITGNLTLPSSSALTVTQGAEILVGGDVVLGGGLSVTLAQRPSKDTPVVISVVSSNGTITGSFESLDAAFPDQLSCEDTLVTPVLAGSTFSLSITLSDARCSPLSIGAIVGIAIGAAVAVGVAIAVAIHCYKRYKSAKFTAEANEGIKARQLEEMKRI